MNFRYKIYKMYEAGIKEYQVEIQIYDPKRKIKHWKHFKYTSLEELCLKYRSSNDFDTMKKLFTDYNITDIITNFIKNCLKSKEINNIQEIQVKEFENKILTKNWIQIKIEE